MRTRCLVLGLALALGGCRDGRPLTEPDLTPSGELPPLPQPQPAVPADSGRVLLAGSARVVGNDSTAWVSVGVTAFNAGSDPVRLSDLCIVQVRAYAVSSPSPGPAWATPTTPASGCPVVPGLETLPAGSKYWLRGADGLLRPDAILGGAQSGRYRFEALVRAGRDTLAVAADTVGLLLDARPFVRDPQRLKYAVDTRIDGVAPRYLETRVAVTNPLDRPFYLEFGACSLRIHAYRSAARTGTPVWRSEDRQPPGGGIYACPLYLATRLLMPGESFAPGEFSARIPMEEILADSLPTGRYYFLAHVSFQQGSGQTLTSPTVSLLAGEADLTSTPDPLPQERVVGGVHYRAQVVEDPATPASARLDLTVTNAGTERTVLAPYVGNCTAQLVGYASAAERDVAYRRTTADLTFRTCPVILPTTSLGPGETRTFSGSAAVAGSPPRKRYYFAAWLFIQQEPQGIGTIVSVAAGDALLGGS